MEKQKMSIKLKAAIVLLILLTIALIYNITGFAATINGKSTVQVWITNYGGNTNEFSFSESGYNVYCVQQGIVFSNYANKKITMNVKDHIHIDGNTSTINSGSSTTTTNNGVMAYIFNKAESGSNDHIAASKYSSKQKAIYGFFGTWAKSIGLSFTYNGNGYNNQSWINEGRNYANNLENQKSASMTDQTNQSSVKVTATTYNGTSYMLVGPFKWSFEGDLSNVKVEDQNGNAISGVLYAKYSGSNLTANSDATKIITSGSNFYILVNPSQGVTSITGVSGKVTVSNEKIVADVYTLQISSIQNLIAFKTSTTEEEDSVDTTFDYDIPLLMDISGYVWEDMPGGKNSSYDNVYHGSSYVEDNVTYDGNDTLVQGMTVNLKDSSGNTISTTTTDSNGAYRFTDLKISDVANYYVEFVYNGLEYTSVTALVGTDSSINSKASEVVSERKALNAAFTEITNSGDVNNSSQGYSRNASGTTTSTLTYSNDTENWKSTFESTTYNTNITANTSVTNYSIKEQVDSGNYIVNSNGKIEVQYINLGIMQREQPHIGISTDIESVQVDVNGYSHVYSYAQRNQYVENSTAFNVAVKFGNVYTDTYTRAIYPSDVQYSIDNSDDANKLKVYVTYSIILRNKSSNLSYTANELVNYYDDDYTLVSSWLGDDESNTVTWSSTSKYGQTYNSDGYVGMYTTALEGTQLAAGTNSTKIYIKFQVSDTATLGLLNENATLNNVTEIFGYTSYYGTAKEGCSAGEVYGHVDEASAVGNAIPGVEDTYEDDTDRAPSLVLEATGVREIEGTVFEDSTAEELLSGDERLGDGLYDSNTENTVKGVKVELISMSQNPGNVATIYPNSFVDTDGDGEEECVPDTEGVLAELTTGDDGYYIFRGVEPDEYIIKYTYENGTTKIVDSNGNEIDVSVQEYKSTILTSSTIINAFNNGDLEWYKKEVDSRYSDAKDDYSQRLAIDEEIKYVDNSNADVLNSNSVTITQMTSQTPQFDMGVEYESVYTSSTGEQYTYTVSNVDFGIVERPRQAAQLDKIVSNIKVTLANGQVIIDGDPSTGLSYVIYTDDAIYVTIDNELLYGAHIEIDYALTFTNASELDYTEESYYMYGIVENEDNIVKFTSSTIMDYVDNELVIKSAEGNNAWSEIANVSDLLEYGIDLTEEEIQALLSQYSTVVTAEAIAEDIELAPGETYDTYIYLEKLLASADELTYENNGEVITVTKTGGSTLTTIPGNYIEELIIDQSTPPTDIDEAEAYTVTIIPPTGLTNNTVAYVIIALASLAILAVGIIVIRKIVKL